MVLGQWWIESTLAAFDSAQVNERVNSHVKRQAPDGLQGRQRYRIRCPGCGRKPVLRQDTIDAKLAVAYERNAQQKVVYLPV